MTISSVHASGRFHPGEQERVVNGTIVKECRQLLVHVLPGVRAAERQMDTNISDLTDAGDWPPDGLELFGHHRD